MDSSLKASCGAFAKGEGRAGRERKAERKAEAEAGRVGSIESCDCREGSNPADESSKELEELIGFSSFGTKKKK